MITRTDKVLPFVMEILSYRSHNMRGNWNQMEPRTMAPEQEQQLHQHQQTMLANQPEQVKQQQAAQPQQQQRQQKQAASTTPGWINDRIVVKEEPVDDKNNDSGISPGHYTSGSGSPQSRQSPRTTTSNGSITPESMVSHDSNDVQMNEYQYRPRSSTPPIMDFQATLDYANARLGQQAPAPAPQKSPSFPVINPEEVSSVEALGFDLPEELDFSNEMLECPLCSYKSLRRIAFSEHIRSHCPVAAELCRPYEFSRSLVKQLLNSANINNLDRIAPTLEDYDLLGVCEHEFRTPKLSQNKVKVFRCKQCGFVAMTKVDYWMHIRQHIKPEKILTCPNCSFVTEYKHHLEYHLRNHFKSKPYKCDKCTYACVNKSMLNSHLKSHSTVYQFRCRDCSYATKYCHSLKLHLRKYDHKPAMVLNPDGSPNPLPIIDVYGTRRGPKAKPKKDDQAQAPSNNGAAVAQQQQQQQISPLAAGAMPQFQFNPLNGFQGFNGQALPTTPALLGFPYSPIFAGFPMSNAFTMNTAADFSGTMVPEEADQDPPAQDSYISVNSQLAKDPAITKPAAASPTAKQEKPDSAESSNPLDLSKTENAAHDLSANAAQTPTVTASSAATPVRSPQGGRANRRKGRAYRVDRHFVGYNGADEDMPQEAQRASPAERLQVHLPTSSPASSSGDSKESNTSNVSNEFTCEYCDISFGNEVMHSVHMGYHGFQNPYTCNMCGVPCPDKVTFFLHIARVKH